MMITKCDICKKQIKKDSEKMSVGIGWVGRYDFCSPCGKPVVKFLMKHKLIDSEKIDTFSG